MSIVCDTGFINIVDPFLNPDSTVWTGSITYTLQYATTVAGATLVEARQVINVSDGIDICLAPGLYTVVYNQSGQRLPVTSQWTVPPTGGPYTIADLEGVGPVTGSLTVTGPFIAMSTVTMTSLINAAARPYVATDSVGLLSTGNLALIAISGSASDLASGTVAAARGGAGTLSGLLKANGAGVVSAAVAGTDYAVATNGTNAQFLTSNGAGGFGTAVSSTGSGSVVLATSPTLTTPDLGTPSTLVLTNATGLPAAAMPGLTGDVTSSAGSVATTVVKINGTTLSGLATGILKNTTATGVPSIAVAGTDYSVATNGTIGQALTSNGTGGFGTALTLATVATSGSASDLTAGTLAAARGGAGTLSGILKANGAGVVSAAAAGTDYAVATNGTLGQVLTSNAAGGFSTALTLATVATSGSASDLTAGTLAAARMPALTGDVTTTVGTVATTVSKINGTTLSGLATGLLKNTTATGVPSIAVAGTDLIGGVGNLTTVGAVPYVSASGTLNQDAGQLHWDATNNRLGIGTATPGSALDVSSAPLTTFTNNPITTTLISTTAYAANMGPGIQFQGKWNSAGQSTTFAYIGGVKENSTDGNYDGKLVFGTRQNGLGANDMTRMTILASGNVGIGTATPATTLQVVGGKILLDNAQAIQFKDSAGNAVSILNVSSGDNVTLSTPSGGDLYLNQSSYLVVKSTGSVGIGAVSPSNKLTVVGAMSVGSATYNTVAPTNGMIIEGNVGIGTTAPGVKLDVLGSARVYNSAADAAILLGSDQVDANSGKISYNRGTANLDITPRSTYATNLAGKLKFSITNSTGAGSALLGANCPAVTVINPYTWITVTTSDGSIGYMPIWK